MTTQAATTYCPFNGAPIAMKQGLGVTYLHHDQLGSLVSATNSIGGEVFTARYWPFGSLRTSTGTAPTDRFFAGQTRDLGNDTFYFFKSRYLDTTIGKFHIPDTLVPDPGNPQALNRYSYVLNQLLKLQDPTGHMYDSSNSDSSGSVDVSTTMSVDLSPTLYDTSDSGSGTYDNPEASSNVASAPLVWSPDSSSTSGGDSAVSVQEPTTGAPTSGSAPSSSSGGSTSSSPSVQSPAVGTAWENYLNTAVTIGTAVASSQTNWQVQGSFYEQLSLYQTPDFTALSYYSEMSVEATRVATPLARTASTIARFSPYAFGAVDETAIVLQGIQGKKSLGVTAAETGIVAAGVVAAVAVGSFGLAPAIIGGLIIAGAVGATEYAIEHPGASPSQLLQAGVASVDPFAQPPS